MRFLSLGIGQTCVKVLDSRENAGGRYAIGLFLQLPLALRCRRIGIRLHRLG
jgi:hypothetical protein